ncbi:hypothetical protein DIPPA_07603 [Diplonema papillatum]|nr:hypothetical protein DIPPA_07603 [Diplonema papillatum]KAJ9460243.1 hypothetical protein DIPPA_07603 [Diplonema papillatum]
MLAPPRKSVGGTRLRVSRNIGGDETQQQEVRQGKRWLSSGDESLAGGGAAGTHSVAAGGVRVFPQPATPGVSPCVSGAAEVDAYRWKNSAERPLPRPEAPPARSSRFQHRPAGSISLDWPRGPVSSARKT